jgi:hypothetical protein
MEVSLTARETADPIEGGIDLYTGLEGIKSRATTPTYSHRTANNLLRRSVANTPSGANGEWRFTGNITDNERTHVTCQFCGKEGLRYQFEVWNALTDVMMLVGSKCIFRFNVSVYNGDQRLTPREAQKHLGGLTQSLQDEDCIKVFEQLVAKDAMKSLRGTYELYVRSLRLTPKQAALVFWRLEYNQIAYSPSFFRIRLGVSQQADLKAFPSYKVRLLWPALTTAQRHKAIALGQFPPA